MPIINAKDFSGTVQKYLDEFGEQAYEAHYNAINKVARDVARDLKKAGSFGGTGEYRKSIKSEIVKSRIGGVSAKIGAGKQAGLTHLLEFGHAKANGGRTTAFNFVKPINDTVEERYMREMEELLNEG